MSSLFMPLGERNAHRELHTRHYTVYAEACYLKHLLMFESVYLKSTARLTAKKKNCITLTLITLAEQAADDYGVS